MRKVERLIDVVIPLIARIKNKRAVRLFPDGLFGDSGLMRGPIGIFRQGAVFDARIAQRPCRTVVPAVERGGIARPVRTIGNTGGKHDSKNIVDVRSVSVVTGKPDPVRVGENRDPREFLLNRPILPRIDAFQDIHIA